MIFIGKRSLSRSYHSIEFLIELDLDLTVAEENFVQMEIGIEIKSCSIQILLMYELLFIEHFLPVSC